MAITNKEEGVWGIDQVFNKQNQGSIWDYDGLDSLFVWGKGSVGALGQNDQASKSSPVQVPGTTWQYLSRATGNDSNTMLATKTDGTLWAWGRNGNGQLGQNNETHRSSPIQIPGTWSGELEVAGQSSFGIKTDGTLWAWGRNTSGYGRLGLNNKTSYSSPAQIPGTTWDKIETYGASTLATKTDGTLWSWGYGDFGRLGLNQNSNFSSPKQVPGTTWGGAMSGGGNFAGAIKTDGTLWMFGYNASGVLGQNNRTNYSSPRQVGSDSTWSKIASMNNSILAIKTDNTMWAWGQNTNGKLGLNQATSVAYSSPVQVPGTTWANFLTNNNSAIAVKTDNTMWAWGANSEGGELAQNDRTARSSPTQIPGDWKQGDRQIGSIEFGFTAIKDL